MTDLHTHILPEMDDGAKTVQESLDMLAAQRSQGVDTVVLTPHFYPHREEPDEFLERRSRSMETLRQAIEELPDGGSRLPRLVLGAEVAWRSDLLECERLNELCIGETSNLLLELPFKPWSNLMIDQLYELIGRTGVRPVIAHLDRYLGLQSRGLLDEIMKLGVPVQVGTDILMRPLHRRKALKLLKTGKAQFVASDCHDLAKRPPNLAAAMSLLRSKLESWQVEEMIRCADKLVEA